MACFGFEGWNWVLIASVPDLCILFILLFKWFEPPQNKQMTYVPDDDVGSHLLGKKGLKLFVLDNVNNNDHNLICRFAVRSFYSDEIIL